MKLRHTTSALTKSILALTASVSLNAFAGTQVAAEKNPVEKDETFYAVAGLPISGSVEVGYDSRYYFRGLWFADQTTWAGVNFSMPLKAISEKLTVNFGALYTSTVDTKVNAGFPNENLDYSELDLIGSLSYDLGFAKASLVYTSYQFFDTFSGRTNPSGNFGAGETSILHTNELGFTVSAPLGPVNLSAGYYYDFNIGGSYAELGLDYPVKVQPWLTLIPAVKSGYGFDYYSFGTQNAIIDGTKDGFTHILMSLSAPVNLTKTATFTPYVAWNISGPARQANNTQNSEVFGGAKLGISF
jgi:hypothetical protein